MENNKFVNTIQICIKSRNYSIGETLILDIRSNKVSLVVLAKDAGEATKKKIKDKCNSFEVECIDDILTKDELSEIFNKDISAFGIKDINLSKKFKNNLK